MVTYRTYNEATKRTVCKMAFFRVESSLFRHLLAERSQMCLYSRLPQKQFFSCSWEDDLHQLAKTFWGVSKQKSQLHGKKKKTGFRGCVAQRMDLLRRSGQALCSTRHEVPWQSQMFWDEAQKKHHQWLWVACQFWIVMGLVLKITTKRTCSGLTHVFIGLIVIGGWMTREMGLFKMEGVPEMWPYLSVSRESLICKNSNVEKYSSMLLLLAVW